MKKMGEREWKKKENNNRKEVEVEDGGREIRNILAVTHIIECGNQRTAYENIYGIGKFHK